MGLIFTIAVLDNENKIRITIVHTEPKMEGIRSQADVFPLLPAPHFLIQYFFSVPMKVRLGTRKIMCRGVLYFTASQDEGDYLPLWTALSTAQKHLHLGRSWSCWASPWQSYRGKGLRFDRTCGSLSCLPPPSSDSEADLNCSGGRGREMLLESQWAPLGTNRLSRIHAEMWVAQHLLLSDSNKTPPSYTL